MDAAGARVDSEVPVYELSIPEVWSGWTWTEKYPGREELMRYFDHVESVLGVKEDVEFGAKVVSADFEVPKNRWTVRAEDGRIATSKYLVIAVGCLGLAWHIPDFKGLESFKGTIHHSSSWPQSGVDVRGKRAAIIGTGATGIQISQEWAREAGGLTIFQRTPNLALPMRQGQLSAESQEAGKPTYPQFFIDRLKTFSGMRYTFFNKNAVDCTPEEREELYEKLWTNGGFEFWLATYQDTLLDPKANRFAYDFWAKKTRQRINDPKKKDILAPLQPIHPFGTKRPSLEQNYYEIFNQPNVEIVDIKDNGISEIKEDGILLMDGSFYPVDIIALATGFDAVTGNMVQMGLKSINGKPLQEEWEDGVMTYLGLCRNGYPNMFFTYGAQAPTGFSNGPSTAELQGRWIVDAIQKMEETGLSYINPTSDAEKLWKKKIDEMSNATLIPLANSWYMGANIPGKKREQLNFAGGLPAYEDECRKALSTWEGFSVA